MTRPTPAMRAAIAAAKVGDDVWGEDPTVLALQERVAALYGMEEALFVPSGTMANQLALLCHAQRGDEVFGPRGAHVNTYEAGAAAALAQVQFTELGDQRGRYDAEALLEALRPQDLHSARAGLVWIENTHNRGGGTPLTPDDQQALTRLAQSLRVPVHVDGARLLNAATALGVPPTALLQQVDSASLCLSKGLGAPAGSLLVGNVDFIARAKRWRKRLGGAMRQVGILAAAGIYALDHHVARIGEDHANATLIARGLKRHPRLLVEPAPIRTNIVMFALDEDAPPTQAFLAQCVAEGVLLAAFGPRRVRAVTHLDVTGADCERAVAVIARAANARS